MIWGLTNSGLASPKEFSFEIYREREGERREERGREEGAEMRGGGERGNRDRERRRPKF